MTPRQSFAIFCKTKFDVRACAPTDAEIDSVLGKTVSNADAVAIVSRWTGAICKGQATEKPKTLWAQVLREANEAGARAAMGARVVPMVVGSPSTPLGNDIDPTKQTYFVADGVCGFAGVVISDGRSSFAKYLRENKIGFKDYYGGWHVSVHEYNQSLQRKEAHAGAMAEVFHKYGVKCRVSSRMD